MLCNHLALLSVQLHAQLQTGLALLVQRGLQQVSHILLRSLIDWQQITFRALCRRPPLLHPQQITIFLTERSAHEHKDVTHIIEQFLLDPLALIFVKAPRKPCP
jgi:hypothetical protein